MSPSTRDPAAHDHPEPDGGRRGRTGRFVRHYLEMVLAMMIGMGVGMVVHELLGLPDGTAFRLIEMAAWMTVPMVGWMRFRGHGWRACNEMAAAMLIPAAGVVALFATDALTDADDLLMLEHMVMLPAMLVAMLLRRDEYTGHHGAHDHDHGHTGATA